MNNITTIIWSRAHFFEGHPLNPNMYYFVRDDGTVLWEEADEIVPEGFLRIPMTALFEFGGTPVEAIEALQKAGLLRKAITKTDEL